MIHLITKKRGFTLIETLFYIVGVILFLFVISALFIYMYSWYRRVTIDPRVDHAGIVLVDTLVRGIRGGETVNLGQSSLATNNGALSLTGTVNLVDITKRFSLSNGRVLYEQTSSPSSYISPSGMTVSRMYFTNLTSPLSSAVKFDIDISYAVKGSTITKTYSGFAILKQSYE
ncbi:MAG: hypothetical protein V4697_03310 [Patescibacteria group bacterium]